MEALFIREEGLDERRAMGNGRKRARTRKRNQTRMQAARPLLFLAKPPSSLTFSIFQPVFPPIPHLRYPHTVYRQTRICIINNNNNAILYQRSLALRSLSLSPPSLSLPTSELALLPVRASKASLKDIFPFLPS